MTPGRIAGTRGMAADLRACRAILRRGSRTFHAASLLLPGRVRDGASAIYAFCRVADHAVDLPDRAATSAVPDGTAASALPALAARLDAVYGDAPLVRPVDRAFRAAVRAHGIPRAVPEALLEGFAWDEEGRAYADLPALCAYAARVGATVGVMMSLVMDRRDEDTLAAAADLGIAMQLTNIARDVGEDARRGRIYLPLDRLAAAGFAAKSVAGAAVDAWPARPEFRAAAGRVTADLLDEADAIYAAAWPGIARLPAACRPAIRAAALLYAEIGNRVRAAGCDSLTRRAWTTRRTRLRLGARAALAATPPPGAFPGAVRAAAAARDAGRPGAPAAARTAAEFLVAAGRGAAPPPA
ncbi:MAG: phytoene/squalene synthase family protein [Gemmatimonadota bacterium]|nr:phytoene/squalene synthase family protein [Gemmatimonadota bacterium]